MKVFAIILGTRSEAIVKFNYISLHSFEELRSIVEHGYSKKFLIVKMASYIMSGT